MILQKVPVDKENSDLVTKELMNLIFLEQLSHRWHPSIEEDEIDT